MLDYGWIILAAGVAVLAGFAGGHMAMGILRRAVRELQYGLADLEDRLVREVKKRAAAIRWEEQPAGNADQKLEDLAEQHGFLPPAEFARRKQEMRHGTRKVPQ